MADFEDGGSISVPALMLSSGALTGVDSVTVSSLMRWTGGSLNGSGSTNIDSENQSAPAQLTIMSTPNQPVNIGDSHTLNLKPASNVIWMGNGGIWMSGKGMVNNMGMVHADDGERFHFNGNSGDTPEVLNTGVFMSDGTITVDQGVAFTNQGTVQVNGTLDIGGTLALFGSVFGDVNVKMTGLFYGSGTVNGNVHNAGQINRADIAGATGTLMITGNYTQTADGTLNIRINALNDYDRIVIMRNATLAGTLNFIFNYQPQSGDTFQIITFSSSTGMFMLNLDPTMFALAYNPKDVTLQAI
jgi:hypothetical protein